MADRGRPEAAAADVGRATSSGAPSPPESILARVLAIAARIAGPNRTPLDAGPSTPLWNGGFWLDSLDLMDLMLACDAAFGPVFDGSSGAAIVDTPTAGELAAAIEAWMRSRAPAPRSSASFAP